jgi:hypothetical protein
MKPTNSFYQPRGKHLALVIALALPNIGSAFAADPFTPIHQPPPCSSAINRGAQAAIDEAALQLKIQNQKRDNELWLKETKISSDGLSAAGIDVQERLNAASDKFEHKQLVLQRSAEIIKFSWKKYNCTPVIFEPYY